jgi:hypothetical protein
MAIDLGDDPGGTPPTTGEKLQIRTAIGLGQTDAPTFAGTSIQSQTDGAHTFRVRNIAGADLITINTSTRNVTLAGDAFNFSTASGHFMSYNAGAIAWSDVSSSTGGTLDLFIRRDAPGILAQRNGTNAQEFRIYNSYSNAGVDFSRLRIGPVDGAGKFYIMSESGGTGVVRGINIRAGAATEISLSVGSIDIVRLNSTSLGFYNDNTYDIGASGANRPRNIYAGSSLFTGSGIGVGIYHPTFGGLAFQSSGVVTVYGGSGYTTFDRLQIGGVTDLFPAIARDGAGIKFTGAAAGSTSWIKVPAVAVDSLPAAATAGVGARSFVNDALTPVFGSAVAGGGAVTVPVYSTGSAWNVG